MTGSRGKDVWILSDRPVSTVTLLRPQAAAVELRRSSNDLPAPDGPRTATHSPRSRLKLVGARPGRVRFETASIVRPDEKRDRPICYAVIAGSDRGEAIGHFGAPSGIGDGVSARSARRIGALRGGGRWTWTMPLPLGSPGSGTNMAASRVRSRVQ